MTEDSDPCEFDCIDCGQHIVSFGYDPPGPQRCVSCLWVKENILPEEETAVRERLGVPLRPSQG